jgi:4,5-DOPA dioxygenase extradiol
LKILNLFNQAQIPAKINSSRGIDHGTWVPLKLIYPNAEIPVVQISIQSNKDENYHYQIGQTLSQLSQKNILIIGSGSITHNLQHISNSTEIPNWVQDFNDEIFAKLTAGDVLSLLKWKNFPYALQNHPTAEHFIPLLIAIGAAKKKFKAQRLHHSFDYNVLSMDSYLL